MKQNFSDNEREIVLEIEINATCGWATNFTVKWALITSGLVLVTEKNYMGNLNKYITTNVIHLYEHFRTDPKKKKMNILE